MSTIKKFVIGLEWMAKEFYNPNAPIPPSGARVARVTPGAPVATPLEKAVEALAEQYQANLDTNHPSLTTPPKNRLSR